MKNSNLINFLILCVYFFSRIKNRFRLIIDREKSIRLINFFYRKYWFSIVINYKLALLFTCLNNLDFIRRGYSLSSFTSAFLLQNLSLQSPVANWRLSSKTTEPLQEIRNAAERTSLVWFCQLFSTFLRPPVPLPRIFNHPSHILRIVFPSFPRISLFMRKRKSSLARISLKSKPIFIAHYRISNEVTSCIKWSIFSFCSQNIF